MAVTFVASGALAANATTTTLPIIAPSLQANDIMIAAILGKDNLTISAPDGTWTSVHAGNNTTAQRVSIFWKRAAAGDSGATFNFTKPTDNNILFCGLISAWRGCVGAGSPIDGTTPTQSANASSDTVTYADFNPTETTGHVVAIGVYNNDLTTAGTISGTNPTLTNRWDEETNTGTDGSIFGYSGDSDGAATGARSHSTTSTNDAINIGVLFGLKALVDTALTPASTTITVTGFAPTVTATNNVFLTPASAPITVTGFAPSVVVNTRLTPGSTVLTVTGFAPTVVVNTSLTPASTPITVTGFAPSVVVNTTLTPAPATIVVTGFAPTVTVGGGVSLTPLPTTIVITGYAPTVTVTGSSITISLDLQGDHALAVAPSGDHALAVAPSGDHGLALAQSGDSSIAASLSGDSSLAVAAEGDVD